MLRYRVRTTDGRRVENTLPLGLVRDSPKEKDAWREVDRLGLLVRINSDSPAPGRIRFKQLAQHYRSADFGADAVRPKTERTILNTMQIVRSYLIPRWGQEIEVTKNPVQPVETRSTTAYKAILVTPQQTLEIIQSLPNSLHRILVLTCAATALRASELLAQRWSDLLWEEEKIAVTKRWSLGKDDPTKTEKSEGHVPLHPALAAEPPR